MKWNSELHTTIQHGIYNLYMSTFFQTYIINGKSSLPILAGKGQTVNLVFIRKLITIVKLS